MWFVIIFRESDITKPGSLCGLFCKHVSEAGNGWTEQSSGVDMITGYRRTWNWRSTKQVQGYSQITKELDKDWRAEVVFDR